MDTAKIIWLMYEQPAREFKEISLRFMDASVATRSPNWAGKR